MAKIDVEYRKILRKIFKKGQRYIDKNRDVERIEIPEYIFRHNVKDGIPIITTKKINHHLVDVELEWFISGRTDLQFLHDRGCHIWDKDAAKYGKDDLGKVYGYYWSKQLPDLIANMKSNITSSELIVISRESHKVDQALPCCHFEYQVVNCEGGFALIWTQRSTDAFLGLPFNILSYFKLGQYLQEKTGIPFVRLQGNLRKVHLYENQIMCALTQMFRSCERYPSIFDIADYQSFPHLKVEMLERTK